MKHKKPRWTEQEKEYLKKVFSKMPYPDIAEKLGRGPQSIKKMIKRMGYPPMTQLEIVNKIKYLEQKKYDSENAMGYFICGFIAGEGCFVGVNKKKNNGIKFNFAIQLASDDSDILKDIQRFIGCGKIYYREKRSPKWKDSCTYQINSTKDAWQYLVPFIDTYGLNNTRKKIQYLQWKKKLYGHIGVVAQ